MSYDKAAFLRHQVERGMTFQGLCRAYGASPSEMRQTLGQAGLLRVVLPEEASGSPPPASEARPIPPRLAHRLTPLQQELYRLLRQVAADGALCPSAIELAKALRSDPGSIQKMLPALVEKGAIRVRVVRQRRVVEIVETGKVTADPPRKRGKRAAEAAKPVPGSPEWWAAREVAA